MSERFGDWGSYLSPANTPVREATYLVVKSKVSVEHDAVDFWDLAKATRAPFLQLSDKSPYAEEYDEEEGFEIETELAWTDTDVFKFKGNGKVEEIATLYASELKNFESWLIFDANGNYIESPQGGPASSAFTQMKKGERFALLFVKWEDDDHKWESRADRLRQSLGASALPFFYPRQGRAFIIRGTAQYRRCAALMRGHDGRGAIYGGIDSDGTPFYNGEWKDEIWISVPC